MSEERSITRRALIKRATALGAAVGLGIVDGRSYIAGSADRAQAVSGEGATGQTAHMTSAPPQRLPIICLEEHVHDPRVASAIQSSFMAEVPYLAGLGTRFRDDPSRYPPDRPRLTFVPDSMRTAAAPLPSRIEDMDRAGIDYQVLSLSNAVQMAPAAEAVSLVQAANDRLADAAARFPKRFSAFFNLPWQDPAAAVLEAERCVRELSLPAALLSGRPASGKFIDDERYEPVLAALAELGAPLFIHPGPPVEAVRLPYYGGFSPEVTARLSLFGWGWHHEAGIQVVRLILSGALDRHRNLKVISGHWGEMVPFFLQRMDDTMPPEATGLARTISQTYRDQVWVGPSGMLDTPHFNFVREVVGAERIIFSVDYPYLTLNGARAWLETLDIPNREKEAIAFRNAEALLGLSLYT